MTQQNDITQRGLIEQLTEIANRDSAVAVTVRADDLRALLSKLRAPVADERAAFKLLDAWQAVCDRIVDQYDGVVAGVDFAALGRANRAALASAPVAGEAIYYAVMHGNALYGIFDTEAAAEACKAQGHPDAPFSVKPLYAAPQASAEDVIPASGHVCNEALEEAAQAAYNELFPTNDRSDWTEFAEHSAQHAAWAAQSIRALKQPQADKDGGTHG